MKKNIIIICVIIALLILGFCLSLFKSDLDVIKKALLTYGFTEVEKNVYYTKVLDGTYDDYIYDGSKYRILNFNMENFTLSESFMENYEDIDFTFNANYMYWYDTLEYNARYTYAGTNVILKGTYISVDNDYTCDVEVSHDADLSQVKNELCDELKTYVISFSTIAEEIFYEEEITIIQENTKE